ncbi:unnamed protein product [Rotaria magnacalcarata]|uniref:Uncharacterized protein n=1 Tax=Rotaria magnacalcarata TaxID=392030 RepID=A0A818Z3W7_9BILA|nr:unnamed protein product [Rotaria magnacalcarata]
MSEIYAEYGLPKNKQNKYDYNQTKPIKDIILNRNKKTDNALHKQILFKEGELYVTRFLLQVNPDEKTTKGKTQLKSIKLSMPEFLFIPNKNARNYYPLDTTGFKRFMEIKGMSKSVAAFNLAEFLEYYLSNPDQEREVNFDTLLKEAGNDFQERYKTSPTEIQQKIENILNNLVKAEYLIKSWRIEKGKWGQTIIIATYSMV